MILVILIGLYAVLALLMFLLIWQGPYTGGGHLTAIPHSLVAGVLWPLVVAFFLVAPYLYRRDK